MAETELPKIVARLDERDAGSQIAYITINNAHKLNTLNSFPPISRRQAAARAEQRSL